MLRIIVRNLFNKVKRSLLQYSAGKSLSYQTMETKNLDAISIGSHIRLLRFSLFIHAFIMKNYTHGINLSFYMVTVYMHR